MEARSLKFITIIVLVMSSSAVDGQEMTGHNDSTAARANVDSTGNMAGRQRIRTHYFGMWSNGRVDPATAALLSIQPMPFDFGNFYAGNWQRGIIYSTTELGLFIPGMVLLSQNWDHRDYYNSQPPGWSSGERNTFYVLLGSYVLVKIVAAFDAGYSAQHAAENISVGFDPKAGGPSLRLAIAIR